MPEETLIVEDGTGKTDAESYISVADADTYVAAYASAADNTAWDLLVVTADKDKALRIGTQYIDLEYGKKFAGYRTNETQALSWPRTSVVDGDGYTIDSDEMPACLGKAVVEAALRYIAGDSLLGVQTTAASISSETKKLGPMEKSTTYVGGKPPASVYPKIKALLAALLGNSSNTMERG